MCIPVGGQEGEYVFGGADLLEARVGVVLLTCDGKGVRHGAYVMSIWYAHKNSYLHTRRLPDTHCNPILLGDITRLWIARVMFPTPVHEFIIQWPARCTKWRAVFDDIAIVDGEGDVDAVGWFAEGV